MKIDDHRLIQKIRQQIEWDKKNGIACFFNENDIKELESN